jgi:hypothetical protein
MGSDATDLVRETILCYECGQSMLHWQFVYHAYDNHNASNAIPTRPDNIEGDRS